MVSSTTVVTIQAILAFLAVVANASLQAYAYYQIRKVYNKSINSADTLISAAKDKIELALKVSLASMISQFAAILLMGVALVMLVIYHNNKVKLADSHISKLVYAALVLSGILLLGGGVTGILMSLNLQCYRGIDLGLDGALDKAWKASAASSVIGIGGFVVLLLVQVILKRKSISDTVSKYSSVIGAAREAHQSWGKNKDL